MDVALVCLYVCKCTHARPCSVLKQRFSRFKLQRQIGNYRKHNWTSSIFLQLYDYTNVTDTINTPHTVIYSVCVRVIFFVLSITLIQVTGWCQYTSAWKLRRENPARWGGVCAVEGFGDWGWSHLLDRSLLEKRNKRISSRYVNVNLQRERGRKKRQTLKQRAG